MVVPLAGCGEDFERVEDGRAEGVGFTFELPDDWSRFKNMHELQAEVSEDVEIPGLDLESGILFAGAWADTGDDDKRPIVNVVIEPITGDSDERALLAGSANLLTQAGAKDVKPSRSRRVAGHPAQALAYTKTEDGEHTEKRFLQIRRGDYAYSVTVQMRTRDDAELDELLDRVAASWRWREADAGELRELAALSEFEGTGYRVTLPPGWRGTGREALAETGALPGVDSIWRGHVGPGRATNVNVGSVVASSDDLDAAMESVEDEERRNLSAGGLELESIQRGADTTLDGEEAGTLEIESVFNGERLRQLEIVALSEGRVYRVTLSSARERYARDRAQFMQALTTWRWLQRPPGG